MSWSISVKVVGSLPASSNNSPDEQNSGPRDFNIHISPDEPLSSLHSKIEQVSGLQAQQQRLIYRGRLISGASSDEAQAAKSLLTPIRNIDGLEDGHTIHLVPRPIASTDVHSNEQNVNRGTVNETRNATSGTVIGSGAGILGALLSLGQDPESDQEQSGTGGDRGGSSSDPLETLISLSRGARSNRRRSRPNAHRRLGTDPRYPDPCPLEPVRQGLMTLHTMIQSQEAIQQKRDADVKNLSYSKALSPLDVNRKWFRGQWLDVRDTVNQWLEATIVEVVTPDDILVRAPKEERDLAHGNRTISVDPAIGASDLEGRLRLLLEPAEDDKDRTLADLNDNEDLVGLVERGNNDHVQLLLIHYNGWPHRWDEWIRSDSERIRPFRTRSKHVSNPNQFCPSPESTFHSAPSTHIKSANDDVDRVAMIPELLRTLTDVHRVFQSAIQSSEKTSSTMENKQGVRPLSLQEQADLSMAMQTLHPDVIEEVMTIVQGTSEGGKDMDPSDVDVAALDSETQWKLKRLLEPICDGQNMNLTNHNQLPWVKTHCEREQSDGDSIDSCRNDEHGVSESTKSINFDKRNLEALGPLLDRLGRVLIDAAPHVAKVAESISSEAHDSGNDRHQMENTDIAMDTSDPPSLRPSWAPARTASLFEPETDETTNDRLSTNPDFVDYVHSFINHRNEGSSGRRSARRSQGEGLGSSILSAYLASLIGGMDVPNGTRNSPRVIRIGGSNDDETAGPGLDIHIHAIVTGPGGPFGMPDFLNNLGNGATQNTNTQGSGNVEPVHQPMQEDDTEQFHNLYSEQPSEDFMQTAFVQNDDVEIEEGNESDGSESEDSNIDESTMPLLESIGPILSTIDTTGNEEVTPGEGSLRFRSNGGENVSELEMGATNNRTSVTYTEEQQINNANVSDVLVPNLLSEDNNRNYSPSTEELNSAEDFSAASNFDEESVHTANEALEENETDCEKEDAAARKHPSEPSKVDITSFIVDSKDGEDMEVCLNPVNVDDNVTAKTSDAISSKVDNQKEYTHEAEYLDDVSMECDDSGTYHSAGAFSPSLHNLERQTDNDDRKPDSSDEDQSSHEHVVKRSSKSLISRLLRRKH